MKLEAKMRLAAARCKNFSEVIRHAKKIHINKNDKGPDHVPYLEIEMDDGSTIYVSTDTPTSKAIKWSYDGDENMPD